MSETFGQPGQPGQPPQQAAGVPAPATAAPAPVPAAPQPPPLPDHIPPQYVAKTPWTAYIKPVLWTIVAIYVIAFVFLNRDVVVINFIFFQSSVPLIFVLVGLALIGAGLCAGVMVMTRRRATKRAEAAVEKAAAAGKKQK